MKYYFEKYKEEYFKVLYEMKKDNFKWYVEKIYGWDEEIQTQFQKDFIEEHRNDINVIKVDNEIIGVFTNYINENDESEISLFYIDKKYQRQGIGTEILQKQLEIDRNNNRNTILQVFKENPARFLYKKVGFEVYEETQTHYKMRRKVKGVIKMYKKIETDNKIFESFEFQKDKYKFNIVSKILAGDEVLLYSDGENYFLARNKVGMPTWIWTKDGLEDKRILEEIKEVISLYLTDLEYDQFTCKKEYYNFLMQIGYDKLNREDYFELGFLTCNKVKSVKQTDGNMIIGTKKDGENLLNLFIQFTEFMNKTLKSTKKATLEELTEEMNNQIEQKRLFCWKNKEGKIVCIANFQVLGDTARIGHVFTLEEERGKGYAANLIHDLTERLLNDGLKPLLYTDYSYPASNKAYINAGYVDKGVLINFSCSREKRKMKRKRRLIMIDNKSMAKINPKPYQKNKAYGELELIFPTKEYKKEVEEYLQEFLNNGENEIAGDGGLDRIKDFDKWLEKVKNDLSIDTIDKDRIPATVYLTIRKSDKKIVGNLQIRHFLNEKLLNYGGHIGDSVRPSERRKRYSNRTNKIGIRKM